MPQILINAHYAFRLGTVSINATSHILCRAPAMPCRQRFRMCRSHLIYILRACWIYTRNAVPMPCPCRAPTMLFWKRLLEATAQHSSGTELHVLINICGLSAACGPPAQIRLLPAITRTLTTVVNQNATAFWDVFNLFWWWWRHQVIQNYTFLRTNLKVKDSLPFVVIIRLHRVFFFWLSVDNNYFKISKFEVIILKY